MAGVVIPCPQCGGKNRVPDMKQHHDPKCGKCKEPLDCSAYVVPVELTDANMDGFIKGETLPVLVDFFSPTCGPCATLAPVLRNLTKKFYKKMLVCTVDTSKNPGCSAFYKIRGVPTLIFFRGGEIIDQITGLPDVSTLESKMDYYSKR